MNYHNITTDDMKNGSGLRVVLWVSGCEHKCKGCQNTQTWDIKSGIKFDGDAENEIMNELRKEYIAGITLSGGDPLHKNNIDAIYKLLRRIKTVFGCSKSIWLYTGYTYEDIYCDKISRTWLSTEELRIKTVRKMIVELCDIMVDGKFDIDKSDVNYHWAGSRNQRVIDTKKTLSSGQIMLLQ